MIANYPINFISSGGGGGGTTFPTFTYNNELWSCDLTYEQTYAIMLSDGVGEYGSIPCIYGTTQWCVAYYYPNDEETQSDFQDIPETVEYGFRVYSGSTPLVYYADNGYLYGKQK